MLAFLNKKKGPFVAVDFEGRSVRLVQAQTAGSQVRVLRVATAPLSEGLDLSDPSAVGKCLGEALKEMRLKEASLLMHVSRSQAVLKTVSLPAGTQDADLPGMVRYQVEKELPFRPEEAVIDFAVESHYDPAGGANSAQGKSVLVGAIRVPMVDYYRQIAHAAGGKLRCLSLRPYACLRTVQACGLTRQHRCLALVHVGSEETEIDVLSDEVLAFSRSAPTKSPSGEAAAGPVAEVVRSLQSYHAVEGSGAIEALYVSGGTGIEDRLVQELSARLEIPVKLFNPAQAMKLLDDGSCGAFVPALGLAISQAQVNPSPFDFANPKRPQPKRDMRKVKRQAAVAAAIVLLAGIVAARVVWINFGLESDVEKLTRARDAALAKSKAVTELAADSDWLEKWPGGDRNWLDHLDNLSIVFPPCEDVYIAHLRTDNDLGKITFNLRAKSDDVIRELDEKLIAAGYDFQRANESMPSVQDESGYNFKSTNATITLKPKVKVNLSVTKPARPVDDASDDPNYKPPKAPKPSPSPTPAPTKASPSPSAVPSPSPDPGRGRYRGEKKP